MRPSFRIGARCSTGALRDAIERRLAAREGEVVGTLASAHCVLEVMADDRRFWTPSLDLMFEASTEQEGPGTRLWGTFSPRAEIWTGFVFTMGTLAIASFFATMFGFGQMALGHAPTALVVPAAALVVGALLYAAALVGQGLSIAEMYTLRAFLDDCLREAEENTAAPSVSAPESAAL